MAEPGGWLRFPALMRGYSKGDKPDLNGAVEIPAGLGEGELT